MKRASDDPPQLPPNRLFSFDLRPTNPPQRWRNVLQRNRFQARLNQHGEPADNADLGGELVGALRDAIDDQLQQTENLQPHHAVHFTMQSDILHTPFSPPPSPCKSSRRTAVGYGPTYRV